MPAVTATWEVEVGGSLFEAQDPNWKTNKSKGVWGVAQVVEGWALCLISSDAKNKQK
jgi:hypothetical protein